MKTKKEELEAELTRLNALRKQVKEKLKALPVYELNRWYKHPNGLLYFINNECEYGHLYGYGFDNDGGWSVRNDDNAFFCAFNSVAKKEITEATPKEVEKAMIEEAKKRYNAGDVIKCLDGVESEVNGTDFVFNNNSLFSNGERINWGDWFNTSAKVFENGQWATIIEQDKFSELKEAHRNGAVIECKQVTGEWFIIENPQWNDYAEYRIKPEEKPKVGDVCKFWDEDENIFIIGELNKIHYSLLDNEFSYPYFTGNDYEYKHAKTITKQEVIDLLFNKGAN